MEAALAEIVAKIHAAPQKIVLVVTGGGSRAISDLLVVPGASRTLLEARVPYASTAMIDFLGAEPEQFCVATTARAMAAQAHVRALALRAVQEPVAGIGCTASLASDRPKRGPHRCHVAVHDHRSTTTFSLQLLKGRRDRPGEEDVVARLVLRAVAQACGLAGAGSDSQEIPIALMEGEEVRCLRTEAPEPVRKLAAGETRRVVVSPDGRMHADGPAVAAVLPGSFNPLHEGHLELARVAADLLGCDVVFEMSITNVDKPPLDFTEIDERLAQFAGRHTVVLTDAPTFIEKARCLPGWVFVVGVDTAERIVAPRYYGDDEGHMQAALEEIRRLGCRFLVAGRAIEGRLITLVDIPLPDGFKDLFEAIPEERFRRDISSTEIRARRRGE